jgi:hypothetical protein
MDREKFIEFQVSMTDDTFALISVEARSRQRFLQLAIDTYDFLMSAGADFVLNFHPWPESAGNALVSSGWGKRTGGPPIELTPELTERWESWNRAYFEIRSRNPRLELRDLMQHISESHAASSWPAGYERHIQEWVDAGNPAATPPFDDRHGIVTPGFFSRLQALRQLCGGWLYWNDRLNSVVFAPEAEWQQVRAAQEAAEARAGRTWQDSHRYATRLQEVMSLARSDRAFWDALRTWELEREATRRSKPVPEPLVGPIRILLRSRPEDERVLRSRPEDEPAKAELWPHDLIFAEFLVRVRVPDDVLNVRDIVSVLRGEMRNELGLDGVLE